MKIYFANNKYLTIDNFNEDYRRGFRHLNFSLNNSNLSFLIQKLLLTLLLLMMKMSQLLLLMMFIILYILLIVA